MTTKEQLGALAGELASTDHDLRTRALAALIAAGPAAVPVIEGVLAGSTTSGRRAAAQALAEIGDPASEGTYRSMLDDPDPTVRARGAQGLHIIGAAGASKALADVINELPDLLRHPVTIPVRALAARGAEGGRAAAPLLADPSKITRERALLVLRMLAGGPDAPSGLAELLVGHDGSKPDPDLTDSVLGLLRD
jgi:HEAT repeat protein